MQNRAPSSTGKAPDRPEAMKDKVTQGQLLPQLNAVELMGKYFEALAYFVTELITVGLTILGSPPKSGKSFFVLGMLIAICQGIPFLGRETKKVRVAYFALEDSPRRIKERIANLMGSENYEDLEFLDIFWQVPRINIPNSEGKYTFKLTPENDFLAFLDKYCKWHRIIIIDVFQSVRVGAGQRNLYESEYKELQTLQRWAQENKVALILVHHFKKGSQGLDPMERISGSAGVAGAADTLITIERNSRSDTDATFTVTGRDIPMQEFICSFDNGIWTYESTVDEKEESIRRANYEENPIVLTIRHLLTKEDEVKITASNLSKEMLELCGWKAKSVKVDKRVLDKLRDDLYFNDRITYEYQSSAGRWHIFGRISDDLYR